MSKLKPCPFCGGEVVITGVKLNNGGFNYSAQCHDLCFNGVNWFGLEKEAVEFFNTRTPQWQPIETIPRDKYVDLWMCMPNSISGGTRLTDCCLLSDGRWVGKITEYPLLNNEACYLSHWMPLPTPPKEQS